MTVRHGLALSAAASVLTLSLAVTAQEATDADRGERESAETPGAEDSSAFLAAGKVGALVPLNGLDPFVLGGVELGWVFGGTRRRIVGLLEVTYSAPHAKGGESDPRLASGSFDWEVRQKQLVFQPTFLYRFSGGRLVPYVGIGPRIYFIETVGFGTAGSEIESTKEQSTKFGVGVPLGAELVLGPGGVFVELGLGWGPLDHRITGDSNLAGVNAVLGYRAML